MHLAKALPLLALFPAILAAQPQCGARGDSSTMLVSTAWLAGHLNDPNLAILFIGQKPDFEKSHIPGALYLDYNDIRLNSDQRPALTLELPLMPQLAGVFANLGVGNNSHIILYASSGIASPETRAFLTLETMGLGAQTSLLDGGFSLWQAEHRAETAEILKVAAGKLQLCPRTDTIVDGDYVHANMQKPGVAIIDARDPQFYTGASISPNKRPGHIPGAGNLTYSTLVDKDGKLNSAEKLREQFAAAGYRAGDRVVSYCHIGQQGTVVYFAARYLGIDARLYDGSWEDWSAHTDWPAAK